VDIADKYHIRRVAADARAARAIEIF